MNKNFKGILIKVLVPVVLIVCVAGGILVQRKSAAKMNDETIVVNNDVSIHDMESDNPLKVTMGEKIQFEENINEVLGFIDDNNIIVEMNNEVYQVNLKDKSTKELKTILKGKKIVTASNSGKRILYADAAKNVYAYDVDTDKSVLLFKNLERMDENSDVQFADEEGKYAVLYRFFPESEFTIADCETGEVKKVVFKDRELSSNLIYTMNGIDIYCKTRDKDGGKQELSIININKPDEIKSVFDKGESNIHQIDVLSDGKSIIFSGFYNKETGIFIYDTEKKSIVKIVSGGKDREGEWTPTYSLSPDGTKLLYDIVTKEIGKSNIYAAKIEGNKLISKTLVKETLVMEKVDLGAVISIATNWKRDSSGVLIKKADYRSPKKRVLEAEVFNF